MDLSYLEDFDSQIPAIQVLQALGWNYLSREEALSLRNGRKDHVVLTEVLSSWLAKNNRIETRGESHYFTDTNIHEAVRRLTEITYDGLVRTNEQIYNLLTLGCSLDQTIDGDRKGRSLHYIDWQVPENNVFHVADEFTVERIRSEEACRPDLVLFVNGIPLVVIECKRRDKDNSSKGKAIDHAIEQVIGYQKDNRIPQLFQYAQLLIGSSVNDVQYGTVGTPKRFWTVWKEQGSGYKQAVHAAANQPLPVDIAAKLFAPLEEKHTQIYRDAKQYFEGVWAEGDRQPTTQDTCLWAMLRKERLLDLIYGYVVFDAGVRKIARYQQFFAVKDTLKRVSALREGQRIGGVVWHTTGSGKSLTMVMLSKALALQPGIQNPRVVIVTDRVDLDDQIWGTFEACGKSAAKAKTGEHLVRLITEGKATVITTIIDKFVTVMGRHNIKDTSPNIFVLIDESHRSNYGATAAMMRRVFPNACYIGFTGTPLLKKEKSTAEKFGGFIHSYTMREAVEDETVAPLLYEGRMALLEQNKEAMQRWFERITEDLSQEQRADLKRKMAQKEMLHKAEQRLRMIAYDVGHHYKKNFQGTGFKAQLAADSRASAILYRQFFNEFGGIRAEAVMSKPDLRKENEAVEDEPMIEKFWAEMMERFGSEQQYLKQILASFSREDGVEILIVVDKLLTGFDEPRNTVLYIDKSLKEHNILQAIARVNRLYNGKEFGYIIDYRGVLGELNAAMNTYDSLGGFDADDVDLTGAVTDSHEEIAQLPQRHTHVWDVFKEVENKKDIESLEQHLAKEDKRHEFYSALREYQNTLAVALATEHFYDDVPKQQIIKYKNDLKFFRSLRNSVQHRYAETIDFSQYEKQIAKVMDAHIQSPDVGIVTELVNIFDTEAFDQEVEKLEGKAAKADTIASRLKKTITEKMEEDPVFYRKFADLVQQAIDDYRQRRIDEAEFLSRVESYMETVRHGHESDMPGELEGNTEAQAVYGIVNEVLGRYEIREPRAEYLVEGKSQPSVPVSMALKIEAILDTLKIRDWPRMPDVVKSMENELDDYLFELNEESYLNLKTSDIDELIERSIAVAKKLAGA